MKTIFIFVITAITTVQANILAVPGQYPKIQLAINAATNGDTVVVSPGTYYENINFSGKNIVVTSRFFEANDLQFVLNTIIDGSQPHHPDTASCVLIVSGENSSAVLQGFTLTGGKGTRWTDEHGAGIYREGGGILVTLSSPTIRYNHIINNEIFNTNTVISVGGGGIRIGDGGGIIENNVITLNKAMYGGGIVLNYCSGTIVRNNMILENSVRQYAQGKQGFGGGGLWLGSPKSGDSSPNIIENNTIVGNVALDDPTASFAAGRGGAMVIHSNVKAIVRNNIIWENHSSYPISSIAVLGADATVEFNDVMGGFTGKGNIDIDPQFSDSAFILSPSSLCIDAGDSSALFHDPFTGTAPGIATPPSRGTSRNDMGAYGGGLAAHFFAFSRPSLFIPVASTVFDYRLAGDSTYRDLLLVNVGSKPVSIDSIRYTTSSSFSTETTFPLFIPVNTSINVKIQWKPVQSIQYKDTMLVYNNSTFQTNPARIDLYGNAIPTPHMVVDLTEHNFGTYDVNTPVKDTTIFVHNNGTGIDSIAVSVNAAGVNPPTAITVSPTLFVLAPNDSQSVTFSFFPKQIIKSFTGSYAPKILFKSYRGEDSTTVEKIMRFRLTGVLAVDDQNHQPTHFDLEQNYPNPFNPTTRIRFSIAEEGPVSLKVFDVLGEEVATVVNEVRPAGIYDISFDASHLSSGVYFYTLKEGVHQSMKKMMILK